MKKKLCLYLIIHLLVVGLCLPSIAESPMTEQEARDKYLTADHNYDVASKRTTDNYRAYSDRTSAVFPCCEQSFDA